MAAVPAEAHHRSPAKPIRLSPPPVWLASGAAPALAVALLLAITIVRLLTHDAWADGSWKDHSRTALATVLIAAAAGAIVRLTVRGPRRAARSLACVTAAVVLLTGDVVHYARLRHPLRPDRALVLADDFTRHEGASAGVPPAPDRWLVETGGGGTAAVAQGRLHVTVPPGGFAYVDRLIPGLPRDPQAFWLPRGLVSSRLEDERLEWRAEVRLDGTYLSLVDTGPVRVRATSTGISVIADLRGDDSRDPEQRIAVPELYRAAHDFLLERTDGLVRLRMDDVSLWVAQDPGPWRFVRLGETRADPLHAGSAAIATARFTRGFAS